MSLPACRPSFTRMALGAALAAGLGCGGGRSGPAHQLVYQPPPAQGFRMVRNAASTPAHLVLDLVGPPGTLIRGGVLTLDAAGTAVAWGDPGGAEDPHLLAGTVLDLGPGTRVVKSQVTGTTLQAALFEKGDTAPATLGDQPLLSVALDLEPGAAPGPVSLIGLGFLLVDDTGNPQTLPVAVGDLNAE